MGPVQLKTALAVSLDPVRFSVLPEQSGPLLEALFPVGEEGLEMVNGPTALDVHPFSVTLISLYSPVARLLMEILVPVPVL